MVEESKIVIIGAGELGHAVGGLLYKKSASIAFWDTDFSKVPDQRSIADIIPGADYILMCIPSWAMRAAVTSFLPFLKKGAIVVSFAKGIENESSDTMSELFADILPIKQSFVVVGGPMLATEISAGKNAVGIFGSKNKSALGKVSKLFSSPGFGIETSDDPFSVSLAGVLKNIYVISLGIADGLELSGNEKGLIASIAISEMLGIARMLQADEAVMLGAAGVADFIATSYCAESNNRTFGYRIAKDGKCGLRAEGFASIPPLMKRLGPDAASLPLLNLVKGICIDCRPARQMFDAFFKKNFA